MTKALATFHHSKVDTAICEEIDNPLEGGRSDFGAYLFLTALTHPQVVARSASSDFT